MNQGNQSQRFRRSNARWLGAAALASVICATTVAAADAPFLETRVRYTGLGCVQYGTTVGSSVAYPWEALMQNDSTSLKNFRCPADIVNNSETYPDGSASMHVYDGNNAQAVLCQLRVFSANDNAGSFSYGSASTTNADVGVKTLSMSVNQNGLAGYPSSRYYIACDLPGKTASGVRSGIIAYDFHTNFL